MSRLIGIVPTARLFANDDPYQDNYVFVNHYVRRVTEAGGVCTDITGAPLPLDGRKSSVAAGGAQAHADFMALIKER